MKFRGLDENRRIGTISLGIGFNCCHERFQRHIAISTAHCDCASLTAHCECASLTAHCEFAILQFQRQILINDGLVGHLVSSDIKYFLIYATD